MTRHKPQQPNETPFDGLLKNLADHFVLELMEDLNGLEGVEECAPVGGEVEVFHRLTDRVWKVLQKQGNNEFEYLFHLEFESQYKANIPRRLGMYGWALSEKNDLPVRHLVWYVSNLRPTGWPKDTWYRDCEYEMKIGNELISLIRWREVWLPGGYKAEEFLEEAPSYLLPFVTLMKGMGKELLAKVQVSILQSTLSEERKQELLLMTVFFASRTLKIAEVMEVIDMSILEKNPFAEYLFEKGLHQARQEEANKTRATLLSLLSRRLDALPLSLVEALEGCEDSDLLRGVFVLITETQEQEELVKVIEAHLEVL